MLVSGNAPPHDRIQQHRNVLDAAEWAGVGKVVYTSVQGADEGTAFSPVVQSNRRTEADVRDSGLDWVIGRNGLRPHAGLPAANGRTFHLHGEPRHPGPVGGPPQLCLRGAARLPSDDGR